MKKLLACLLCLMMLTGMLPACADTLFGGEGSIPPYTMAAVGDALYAVTSDSDGVRLSVWREGMAQAEVIPAALESGEYVDRETLAQKDMRYAVSRIFAVGDRLMGLNTGTGLVFAMEVQGDELVCTDVVTLQDTTPFFPTDDEYGFPAEIVSMFAADGYLYTLLRTWDAAGEYINRCCAFSLTDGAMKEIPAKNAIALAAYKDGKLLALAWETKETARLDDDAEQELFLYVLDPATGAMEKQAPLSYFGAERVVYSAALDVALYLENSRVMGLEGLTEPRQYGYLPIEWPEELVLLDGTLLAAVCNDGVRTTRVSANFNAEEYLNVYNSWMDGGAQLFTKRHPDVPVYFATEYYETVEKLNQAMVSGEDALDVLQMGTSYSSFFTLMEKGYCADLSDDPVLMAAAERLHPVFRDAVMKDGRLYAVPMSAHSFGWAYFPDALEQVGLTADDLPTDMLALCELVTAWNDGLMDDYPEYCLIEGVTDTRTFLFQIMVDMYTQWCAAENRELSFDTPEFRRLMAALEAMRCDEMDRVYAQDDLSGEVYHQPILSYAYTIVSDFSWLAQGSAEWFRILPMQLTPETPFFTDVTMEVAFVNPRSAHQDMAREFLRCKLEGLDNGQTRTLFADATEPAENIWYHQSVQEYQREMDALTAQLETADAAERAYIEAGIEEYRLLIEEQEQYRWEITAEAIMRYQQEIVPAITIAGPGPFGEAGVEEMNSLMQRYLDGQISLDQFIREADSKLWMMRMENQ